MIFSGISRYNRWLLLPMETSLVVASLSWHIRFLVPQGEKKYGKKGIFLFHRPRIFIGCDNVTFHFDKLESSLLFWNYETFTDFSFHFLNLPILINVSGVGCWNTICALRKCCLIENLSKFVWRGQRRYCFQINLDLYLFILINFVS